MNSRATTSSACMVITLVFLIMIAANVAPLNAQTGYTAVVEGLVVKSLARDAIVVADVDNDGKNELVSDSYNQDITIEEYDPISDSYVSVWSTHMTQPSFGIEVADVDNDGFNELITATRDGYVRIWEQANPPHGTSWAISWSDYMWEPLTLTVGDIDDDGNNELLVGSAGTFHLYKHQTQNTYIRIWQSESLPIEVDEGIIGDIDGDGANELILSYMNDVKIFEYQDGSFVLSWSHHFDNPQPWLSIISFWGKGSISLGDIDNDGRVELAVLNSVALPDYWFNININIFEYNQSSHDYSQIWATSFQRQYGGAMGLDIGDVDNDGRNELVAGGIVFEHSSAGLTIALGNHEMISQYPTFVADPDNDGLNEWIKMSKVYRLEMLSNSNPYIASVTPNYGTVNSQVDILGANFWGFGYVTFNGIQAETSLWSDSLISVTVPPGATPGLNSVIVYTSEGLQSNSKLFNVGGPVWPPSLLWDVSWTNPNRATMHAPYNIQLYYSNKDVVPHLFTYGLSLNTEYLNAGGFPFTPTWDANHTLNSVIDLSIPYFFNLTRDETVNASSTDYHAFTITHDWDWIEPTGDFKRYIDMAVNFIPSNLALINELVADYKLLNVVFLFKDIVASAPQIRCTYEGLADSNRGPFQVTIETPLTKLGALISSLLIGPVASQCTSAGYAIGGVVGWSGWGLVPAGAMLVAEAYLLLTKDEYYITAIDPEAEYKVIAAPPQIDEPGLNLIPNSLEKEAAETSIIFYANSKALSRSYARYLAAIRTQDAKWAGIHLAATNYFLDHCANLADELATILTSIEPTIPNPSNEQIADIRSNLTILGLPSIEADILRREGYTDAEIGDIASAMSSANDSFFYSYKTLSETAQSVTNAINATLNTLPESPAGHVLAKINMDPDTLNRLSTGRYITCYVSLPSEFDPGQIDLSSILLNDIHHIAAPNSEILDYNGDGILDLMVKFDRKTVIEDLTAGNNSIVISGKLSDELSFEGIDIIRFIK